MQTIRRSNTGWKNHSDLRMSYVLEAWRDTDEQVFVLTGSWSERYRDALAKSGRILLSRWRGWPGDTLAFLQHVPNIRGVEVYASDVEDLSGLNAHYDTLEYLALDCDANTTLEFERFERLRELRVKWCEVFEGIEQSPRLETLSIRSWPYTELAFLPRLRTLGELFLTSPKLESLSGLTELRMVRKLDLADCPRLANLSELSEHEQLSEVILTRCPKVHDLDPLGTLLSLSKLRVVDCKKLDSVSSLRGCKHLADLALIGNTTVVDGDMSALLKLPRLSKLKLANRRHYKPPAGELKKLVNNRGTAVSSRNTA